MGCWFVGLLFCWCVGLLVCCYPGLLEAFLFRLGLHLGLILDPLSDYCGLISDILKGYFFEGGVGWAGLLGCWDIGFLGSWVIGLLGCWVVGLSMRLVRFEQTNVSVVAYVAGVAVVGAVVLFRDCTVLAPGEVEKLARTRQKSARAQQQPQQRQRQQQRRQRQQRLQRQRQRRQ